MRTYLDILENVLSNGTWKSNRTGTRTLTVANQHFSHDMKNGFPLLTTKQMPLSVIAVELEGFIKGVTSKNWYKERNCKIWNEWANPRIVKQEQYKHFMAGMGFGVNTDDEKDRELTHKIMSEQDDLGPIYGFSWRRFGEAYDENDGGVLCGYDQLKSVVDKLHNNPDDRRMVVSAWNPNQETRMALPPCHFAWVLTHINGTLNLHWTQRSCDLFLGVPFNIASYALLLTLLCKEANMKPGNLSGMLCDCHIYENHIEQCKLQLSRTPKEQPKLEVTGSDDAPFDIFSWVHKDFNLTNYHPCEKIKANVAV